MKGSLSKVGTPPPHNSNILHTLVDSTHTQTHTLVWKIIGSKIIIFGVYMNLFGGTGEVS